jgi:SET domain-containing protein
MSKQSLILDRRIDIRPSKIHGFGVFSNDFIPKDTIIEEAYCITFPDFSAPPTPIGKVAGKYFYKNKENIWQICTGFGMMYNHSDTPNVKWYSPNKNIMVFSTLIDIEKDEELLHNYGPLYVWD